LRSLGEVTYYDTVSKDAAEWLERVKDANVIYSNIHGLDEGWQSLRDTFVTVPFVGVGFLDPQTLKRHNVVVSRSPGCNQVAVSEWIIGMMLNYSRRLPEFIKVTHFNEPTPFYTTSLAGKSACVMGGKGHIGVRVYQVLEALGMNVQSYTRGDDLTNKIKDADFVVDCLSLNPSTLNFYNEAFFEKAKTGVVFVTVSSNKLKDTSTLLKLLDNGKIAHYITDNAQAMLFDANDTDYQALLGNSKATVTPHVAAYSDNTRDTASAMCIENIRAYLAGRPMNIVSES
jgi:glycerate dehydrogenase